MDDLIKAAGLDAKVEGFNDDTRDKLEFQASIFLSAGGTISLREWRDLGIDSQMAMLTAAQKIRAIANEELAKAIMNAMVNETADDAEQRALDSAVATSGAKR